MSKSEAFKEWRKLSDGDQASALAAIPGYVAYLKTKPDLQTIHACRFLSQRRFDGYADPPASSDVDETVWQKRLGFGRQKLQWSAKDWGPLPGAPGCRVPSHLIQPEDGADWREWEASR